MSSAAYGSLMIRNLRKSTDYDKAVQTQNQLLKIAIRNDANIANARKLAKTGAVQPVPEQQTKSPQELAADTAKLEQDTTRQLLDLGFRYAEVQQIVPKLSVDDRVMFNLYYPSIRIDIEKKFNLKLLNVETFLEYLKQYFNNIKASKGVNPLASATLQDKFDVYTDNITDIVSLLPPPTLLQDLKDLVMVSAGKLGIYVADEVAKIEDLERYLPSNPTFITAFQQIPQENQLVIGREIQDVLRNLPSLKQFEKAVADLKSAQGRIDSALSRALQQSTRLVAGVSKNLVDDMNDIYNEVGALVPPPPPPPPVPVPVVPTPVVPTTTSKKPVSIVAKIGTDIPQISSLELSDKDVLKRVDLTKRKNNVINLDTAAKIKTLALDFKDINLWFIGVFGAIPTYADLKDFVKRNDGQFVSLPSAKAPPPSSSYSSAPPPPVKPAAVPPAILSPPSSAPTTGVGVKRSEPSVKRIKLKKIGKGLAVEEEPKYLEFGKFCIHAPQLHNKVLNLKYQSLGNIPKYRPTSISDEFKDFIVMLLETGKAHHKTYDALPEEERKLFEKVAIGAGVFHKLGLKHTKTKEEQDEDTRFRVLKGEYGAGNNNPQLLRELRRMIVKFMNEGRIHKTEGTQLLLELSL